MNSPLIFFSLIHFSTADFHERRKKEKKKEEKEKRLIREKDYLANNPKTFVS